MKVVCQQCRTPLPGSKQSGAAQLCPACQKKLAGDSNAATTEKVEINAPTRGGARSKVLIPAAIRDLDRQLNGGPSSDTRTNGARFRTDHQTGRSQASHQKFLQLYSEVQQKIEEGHFEQASVLLNQLASDASPSQLARCHALRGYLFLQVPDFARAEASCDRSLKLDPIEPQTLAWRAAARGEQNKWRAAFDDLSVACQLEEQEQRRGEYNGLLKSYAQVANEYFRHEINHLAPGQSSAQLLFERGWMFLSLEKKDKAARDFQLALKQNPQHAWAAAGLVALAADTSGPAVVLSNDQQQKLCELGLGGERDCRRVTLLAKARLLHQNHQFQPASEAATQLLALADFDPLLMMQVAQLQSDLDDPMAAIDTLTQLLQVQSQHQVAWLLRGDCAFTVRNDLQAVEDYSEYLSNAADDTQVLLKRAAAESRRGHNDLAIDDLDRAIEIDPGFTDAWLMRGQILLADGQLDQAMTCCQNAKDIDNQVAEIYALLGNVFHEMGDYGRAAEEYSRSVDYANTSADRARYLYHRGIEWYELKEFDDAVKDFSQALVERPDHPGTLIWRAAASSRREQLGAAIEDLQKAMAIRPSSAEAYRKLGLSVAEKAIGFFTRQHQRGNNSWELFHHRGQACHFLRQFEEAIVDYHVALQGDPQQLHVWVDCGQAHLQLNEYKAATDAFNQAIEGRPDDHWARFCRAKAWLEQQKVAKAEADLAEAIRLAPTRSRYHALAAELASRSGDTSQQLLSLSRAIEYDPTDPSLYLSRSIVSESSGRWQQAMRDLTQSLDIEANQLSVLQRRARLAITMKRPQQAIEDFARALAINPLLIDSWIGRAQAFAANNQHQEGLICLTKSIHRFSNPADVARLVFARGQLFHQAGRLAPAVVDYSCVIDLLPEQRAQQAPAMMARGIGCCQLDEFEQAQADFQFLAKHELGDANLVSAGLAWLRDQTTPRPKFLTRPAELVRPTRPPVVHGLKPHWLPQRSWEAPSPHDQWVVQFSPDREFGPVRYDILLLWMREGRVEPETRLLRSDWDRWRKAEKLFPELYDGTPLRFPQVTDFNNG